MIISPGRRLIFVHIPKTGGTAMSLALEDRAKADDILIGDTPKALKRRRRLQGVETAGRLWKHSTLADVEGLVTRDQMAAWFVFTMVRNPWDRMVSYYHWLRDQRFGHPAVALAKETDFAGFLAAPETQVSVSAFPYGRYVTDGAGGEHADRFVRLERLEQDLAPVEAHLGFSIDLPHANASDRERDWRVYYDDVTAGIVGRMCAEDIARFDYRFEP